MKERYQNIQKPLPFTNEHCSFVPISWTSDKGELKPILIKVVTEEMKSLGLRKNPNIMTFPVGEWVKLADGEIIPGNGDQGGIWSALKISGGKTLASYMAEKYSKQVRIFLTAVENPLYANSYRVKSQGVLLLEEIKTK